MKSAGRRPKAVRPAWLREASPLQARFWGTRGSYPVSDQRVARYGGNTACVEVRLGSRLFIVDAGTGIIDLGSSLAQDGITSIDILLSHLHHDHILGLGFFEPLFRPGVRVTLHCGHLDGATAQAPLDTFFQPPLFPIPIQDIAGDLRHVGFKAGETLTFEDGISVRTCPLNHPGGATGYRFDHAGHSLCYLSDMEHTADGPTAQLLSFVGNADLVVYDGMFTEAEYDQHRGWGHSTWNAGVRLCREAGARALSLFHHHPRRTDAELDEIERQLRAELPGSFCAREQRAAAYSTESHVGMMGS